MRGVEEAMKLRTLIPNWQVRQYSAAVARTIRNTVGCRDVVFVVLLEGGKRFAQEVFEHLESPKVIEMKVASYNGTQQGQIKMDPLPQGQIDAIRGKEVIVIDDILDSGKTLTAVVDHLKSLGASKVRAVALLRRAFGNIPDFLLTWGTTIGSQFVVGFGMDYDGKFRELNDIKEVIE